MERSERDRRRRRRTEAEAAGWSAFATAKALEDAARLGASPVDILTAWLGGGDEPDALPDAAKPLLPKPADFSSWATLKARILALPALRPDLEHPRMPGLLVLIAVDAVEPMTDEGNGYELSTYGSRFVERVLRELVEKAAVKQGWGPTDWYDRRIARLKQIEDSDPQGRAEEDDDPADEDDEPRRPAERPPLEDPYDGVTYGRYVYGDEMSRLPEVAGVVSLVVRFAKTALGPSDGPDMELLGEILDEGFQFAYGWTDIEDDRREFLRKVSASAIGALRRAKAGSDEWSRCECGEITGAQCGSRAQRMVVRWVPPSRRAAAEAAGTWRGAVTRLRIDERCIDRLGLRSDRWAEVLR